MRLPHSLRGRRPAFLSELQPASRFALLGLAAAGVVVVFLGTFVSGEVRSRFLEAEAHGLVVAVSAVEPALPDLAGRSALEPAEISLVDGLLRQAFVSEDRIRVKLWSLDGTILYSDLPQLIGRRFPEEQPALAQAAAAGFTSEVSNLDDPENLYETSADQLIEYHLAVHRPAGSVVAVLSTFEDVAVLESALHQIALTTWLAIIGSLGLLVLFLVLLLRSTTRAISGQRAIAAARVTELAILSTAAEALASSLEPARLFETLERRIMPALGLAHLALLPAGEGSPGPGTIALRDGRLLTAQRAEPLSPDEERILRSAAHSLDAASANAALLAEVRGAASERQLLLQRVAEAHEEERRTLVGELHDSLASDLIRTLYAIRRVELQVEGKPELATSIGKIEGMVEDSEARLRAFMNRVRPTALDAFDLAAAVRDLVSRFEQEAGLAVTLHLRGSVAALPEAAQVLLVRALEEALLNIRKHAGASQVRVSLQQAEGSVTLSVDDDGSGWPAAPPDAAAGRGLGLAYLRERVAGYGGSVSTTASRLGGARLRVRLPLAESSP